MADNTKNAEVVPEGLVPELPFDVSIWGEDGDRAHSPSYEELGVDEEEGRAAAQKKAQERYGPPTFPDWD